LGFESLRVRKSSWQNQGLFLCLSCRPLTFFSLPKSALSAKMLVQSVRFGGAAQETTEI